MMVTGTVVAGTRVARQFCRNTMITMSTRMPASNRVSIDLVDALADKDRGVVVDGIRQALREVPAHFGHGLAHVFGGTQGVGAGQGKDEDLGALMAALTGKIAVESAGSAPPGRGP